MTNAYIILPATTVYQACSEYLDDRNTLIDAHREEMIQRLMDNKPWFGHPHTRKSAIKKLQRENGAWYRAAGRSRRWAMAPKLRHSGGVVR